VRWATVRWSWCGRGAVAISSSSTSSAAAQPEFCDALKLGRNEADARVERSLYQKPVGYSFDAVKIFMPAGAVEPIYAPYVEHVPPSDVACIFWLKNRDPAHWRDAWQLEHVTGKYVISDSLDRG